jgi:hypothetical protein
MDEGVRMGGMVQDNARRDKMRPRNMHHSIGLRAANSSHSRVTAAASYAVTYR